MADEMIEKFLPVAKSVAYRRVQNGADYEDMVQEAWITMWLKHEKTPGQSMHYYRKPAQWRVANTADGNGLAFGSEALPTGHSRPTLVGIDDDTFLEALGTTTEYDDDADWSYYTDRLLAAVQSLPSEKDREYVLRRFWCNERPAHLYAELGMDHKRWYNTIRPQLAKALTEIADSVAA